LGILYFIFTVLRSVILTVGGFFGLFQEKPVERIKVEEEPLEIPHTAFDEMVDGVDDDSGTDTEIDKLAYLAKEHPDVLRQVISQWMQSDPNVPEPDKDDTGTPLIQATDVAMVDQGDADSVNFEEEEVSLGA
jgi:hypothetical protein